MPLKSTNSTTAKKNSKKRIVNQGYPPIDRLEYQTKIEIGSIESGFVRNIMQILEEGIQCFNGEVDYTKKLMQGIVADIGSRQFFKKPNGTKPDEDWLTFKNESYKFSTTHLASALQRMVEEILPGFDAIIEMADKKMSGSEKEDTRLAYQSIQHIHRLMIYRQRQIAEVMVYLLTRCALENKLSLITNEQFILFTRYIAKYGFEHTQGKLKRLFDISDTEKGINFDMDVKDHQWVFTVKEAQREAGSVRQQPRMPKQNWFTSLLPGASVYREFLPSQFYVVAQINNRIKTFEKMAAIPAAAPIKPTKIPSSIKQLQTNLKVIQGQMSKPEFQQATMIRIFNQEYDYIKSQDALIQEAIDNIEKKKLKGIKSFVAAVFRRNPNKLLEQWKDTYQVQQQRLMEQKSQLFQKTIGYTKTLYDSEYLSLPDTSLIQLLKEQAQDLESTQVHGTGLTSAMEFKKQYAEYEQVVDIAHHYIACIVNEDRVYIHREMFEKDGITIHVLSATRLTMITNKVLKYETGEKGNIIKLISDWVRGEFLPTSLSVMRNLLKPLFVKQEQEVDQFIHVLIEKYIKKTVFSVNSTAFKLIQEYDPTFAEEWVKEHQQQAIDAHFFLDNLLDNQNQEAITVHTRQMLPTVSNAIQQAKLLKALSYQAEGFVDYWSEFKKSLINKLLSTDSIVYQNLDFIDFVNALEDEELNVYYGDKLLEILLKERHLGKLLDAENFYKMHVNNQTLQTLIQQRLDALIQQDDWDPYIHNVIEAIGQVHLKQAYRLNWFERVLFHKETLDADDQDNWHGDSLIELTDYYGESNIPKLIELMEIFLNQGAEQNEQGLTLVCRYVTPEFTQKYKADRLNKQLKKYREKITKNQVAQAEANEIIEKLKQVQSTYSYDNVLVAGEEIQSKIRVIFHRMSLHFNINDELENDRLLISALLRKFANFLSELADCEQPKIIQAWMDKFDPLSQQQTEAKFHSVLTIPPFPQPYLWLFVDEIKAGLNRLGINAGNLLFQQFTSICIEFHHLTQVTSYFIEKVQGMHTFTQDQRQAANGLIIHLPNKAELAELVEYIMQQPLSVKEVEAIRLLQELLAGSDCLASLSKLKEALSCLFEKYPQPEIAENHFIKTLFNQYIIPSLTSIHSPAYLLLKEYDNLRAKEWYEKQISLVEESLYFIKEAFAPKKEIGEYAEPILCGGKEIVPTIENILQHLLRIRDFSSSDMNYFVEIQKLAGEYIHYYKSQPLDAEHHAIITAIGDNNLIVGYGLSLLKFLLGQGQIAVITQHPFIVDNQNNKLLQAVMAKECMAYFSKHIEWNLQWAELLLFFNQEPYRLKLLRELLKSQSHWHPELHELIESTTDEALKQNCRLRWFASVLMNAELANQYMGEYDLFNTSLSLEALLGEAHLIEVFQMVEVFMQKGCSHEAGVKLIDIILNEDTVKQYELGALYNQWLSYKTLLFKRKELDAHVLGIIKDLEDQHYKSAISKLKIILDNFKRYTEGTEQYVTQVAILNRLFAHLGALIKKWIDIKAQQSLALLESYFIELLPDSKGKQELISLCQDHHLDYQFHKDDELSLTLFTLYTSQLEDFDERLFTALKTEYVDSKNTFPESKPTHIDKLKSIRDGMVATKISQVRCLNYLSLDDKSMLKMSGGWMKFINQDNTVEVAIDSSTKAHLLRENIGKKTSNLRPISEFFEEVKKLNEDVVSKSEAIVRNKAVKEILSGAYHDGFLCEFPELIMQEYSPYIKKSVYKEALRDLENGTIKAIKDFDTLKNYGDALKAVGRYHRAIACYEQALVLRPKDVYVHRQNIIAKFYTQKYLEVQESLNNVLKFSMPESDRNILIYYRAQTYRQLDNFDKAIADTEYLKDRGFQIDLDEHACPAMNLLTKK